MKRSIKGWIKKKKWKISKSSKKFCRIHFDTMSTHFYSVSLHFYTVCLQKTSVDCCVRSSWVGGRRRGGFLILRRVSIVSDFGYKWIACEGCYPKKYPQNATHCEEVQISSTRKAAQNPSTPPSPREALSANRAFISHVKWPCCCRGYLCISYTKTSHRQTGKKSLVLFITE